MSGRLLAAALLLAASGAGAQWKDSLSIRPGYDVLAHQETAMNILLAWGGASVGAGAAMLASDSPYMRGFGIQNLAWGAIDAGIALWAKSSIGEKRQGGFSPEEERESFRQILLINTLLDVLYIAVGIGLMFSDRESVRGHGVGITVQGSFLFLFDGVNYLIADG